MMQSGRRIPLIIDTDPGVDDVLGLLLALASPEIEIVAIIVTFGNTDVDACYLNIFRVYRALAHHLELHPEDRRRFPNFDPEDPARRPALVRGSSGPLEGELHSAIYFHGKDGLGGLSTRHPELDAGVDLVAEGQRFFRETEESASEVVLRILREQPPRSVTYAALGPLTTLASVMKYDASTFRQVIGRVVCMGGALDVPGNTTPVAEFNWFADPYAVRALLTSSDTNFTLPLDRFVMLPLDITTPHELPFPIYKERVDPAFESTARASQAGQKSPLIHFTSSFLERAREVMLEFGKDALELHDPVAIWCAIANPNDVEDPSATPLAGGWRAVHRKFDIERTGELTRGMCVVDHRDDQGAYAPGDNRAHVQAGLNLTEARSTGGEGPAVFPARVEVETGGPPTAVTKPSQINAHSTNAPSESSDKGSEQGVRVVTSTPGAHVILQLLLQRVWGVEL